MHHLRVRSLFPKTSNLKIGIPVHSSQGLSTEKLEAEYWNFEGVPRKGFDGTCKRSGSRWDILESRLKRKSKRFILERLGVPRPKYSLTTDIYQSTCYANHAHDDDRHSSTSIIAQFYPASKLSRAWYHFCQSSSSSTVFGGDPSLFNLRFSTQPDGPVEWYYLIVVVSSDSTFITVTVCHAELLTHTRVEFTLLSVVLAAPFKNRKPPFPHYRA